MSSEPDTHPPTRLAHKPKECPRCGHRPVAGISYGLPMMTEDLERRVKEGRTVLGGCCVSGDDPVWECRNCGWQGWRSR